MKAGRILQEELDKMKIKFTQACKEYEHQQKLLRDADQLQLQSMDQACRQQVATIKTEAELAMKRCLQDQENARVAILDSEDRLRRAQDEVSSLHISSQQATQSKREAELSLQTTCSQANAALAQKDSTIQMQATAAQSEIDRLRLDFENQLRM